MRLTFCILNVLGDVLNDGELHFMEAAQSLDAAKERVQALAELWPGADHEIFRKIQPAHLPRRVDKEFRWSRDVCTVAPAVQVHQIPPANHVLLCIRKNRKRVALRPTQVFGILARIHTDGHHSNFPCIELRQRLLETP
jgi:hypothetical protein